MVEVMFVSVILQVQDLEAENKRLYEQLNSLQKNKDDAKSKKNGNIVCIFIYMNFF